MKEKTTTLYICETCCTEYPDRGSAVACEVSGIPEKSAHWEIGKEVRLKNRNRGYTLAVIIRSRVTRVFFGLHEHMLVLDREVYLDCKWESKTNVVSEFYVLTDERAAGMERMDNCAE